MILMDKSKLQQDLKRNNDTPLTIHYRMTRMKLFIGSLHSLYSIGLFLLFIGIFYKIDDIFSFNTPIVNLVGILTQSIFSFIIFTLILALITVFIGMIILHIKYRHYEVASDQHYIYISKRSTNEQYLTIPRSALQCITIEKPITQRPFQLVTIKLDYVTTTYTSEAIQTALLIPFIQEQRGKQLIEEIQPDYCIQEPSLSLAGEAYFVELIQPSYLLVIVTFLIMFFWPELWFVPILYALYLIVKRVVKTRQQYYNWSANVIAIRSGAFSPTLHLVKREHITMLQIHQSWIQRKVKLATCQLTIRNNSVQLNHVNESVIEQLYDWFVQQEMK